MNQSPTKQVVLIRHAQSAANAGLATSDPTTISLTQEGIGQASHAANTIEFVPDLIVSSPFLRARQTAAPFVKRFGIAEVIWPVVQEFVFLNFRDQAAMTPIQRRGLVGDYWARSDPDERHPGGESFRELWGRVQDLSREIDSCEASRLLIVSHGFYMSCFRFAMDGVQFARPVTPALMQTLHEHHAADPVPNCHVLRYAPWHSTSTLSAQTK